MEKRKAKCGGYGMFTGIYWVIGLGILLGALLGIPFKPADEWALSQLAAAAGHRHRARLHRACPPSTGSCSGSPSPRIRFPMIWLSPTAPSPANAWPR